jgi:hypothetical protein
LLARAWQGSDADRMTPDGTISLMVAPPAGPAPCRNHHPRPVRHSRLAARRRPHCDQVHGSGSLRPPTRSPCQFPSLRYAISPAYAPNIACPCFQFLAACAHSRDACAQFTGARGQLRGICRQLRQWSRAFFRHECPLTCAARTIRRRFIEMTSHLASNDALGQFNQTAGRYNLGHLRAHLPGRCALEICGSIHLMMRSDPRRHASAHLRAVVAG